jgi:signal transduction histidine kinase
MSLALPVLSQDRLVAVVFLSQPLRDTMQVLRDLRALWLVSMLASLVLAGAVGLLRAGAIARPVHRLTTAAAAVAEGELEQRVAVESHDELGRLSHAFNEMTARLRASRQAQTEFVANVSHELRTPLTALRGLVETLRDGAADDMAVRDHFLASMEGETGRMIGLVNDLLTLSRADSDALDLRREPFNIRRLIEDACVRVTPEAGRRGVMLATEFAPELQLALGDPNRIEQVLLNLLDNAILYSSPSGSVTVEAGCDAGMVRVQVRDDGIGIPAEALGRIGERFYRTDRARARAQGGSGLGLAIARALVEAHGGDLCIESLEGRGTAVTFTLPTS